MLIENGSWEGCVPLYYKRVSFCLALRWVAVSGALGSVSSGSLGEKGILLPRVHQRIGTKKVSSRKKILHSDRDEGTETNDNT